MSFIIGMVVVTAIAGAGGYIFASQVLINQSAAIVASPSTTEAADGPKDPSHAEESKDDKTVHPKLEIIPLVPIVTNLAKPDKTFVRLEGSLLIEKDTAEVSVLVAKVSEDVIALLRSMALSEIQGANGLAHLRDDINDRVRVRSNGKARELIISTLVME